VAHSASELVFAFGIAGSETSPCRLLYERWTHGGVNSQTGFTASTSILEGHFGFGNLSVGPGTFDFTRLIKHYGNPWELASSRVG
jgi:hypothetical protein